MLLKISTHTPHAGRDSIGKADKLRRVISTHTPHAGRDYPFKTSEVFAVEFQLTRPTRGVTASIGRGMKPHSFQLTRPTRGVTARKRIVVLTCHEFQLTRPTRGVTRLDCAYQILVPISTHTPHAGRDKCRCQVLSVWTISTHTPHAGRDSDL